MGRHLIVGAGGVGSTTAQLLVDAGHDVLVVSRSGRPHADARVRTMAIDATNAEELTKAALGADSIVNAANPRSYTSWPRDWPPMAAAMLQAAEHSGAGLVIVDNLYCYGVVDAPMTECTPIRPNGRKGEVRAAMWREALDAHNAGRIRTASLRASDYIGPGCRPDQSFMTRFVIEPASTGKAVTVPIGRVDVPHSVAYVPDVAALAARLALGDGWGEAWHLPCSPPVTVRQIATDAARATGAQTPKVSAMPRAVVSLGGLVVPLFRELWETRHSFERPWIVDATKTTSRLGLVATPWQEALRSSLGSLSVRPDQQRAAQPR